MALSKKVQKLIITGINKHGKATAKWSHSKPTGKGHNVVYLDIKDYGQIAVWGVPSTPSDWTNKANQICQAVNRAMRAGQYETSLRSH